mgnify:CR=1 FL=1
MECVFLQAGFVFSRQKGDHRAYVREGCARPVVIPAYEEINVDIILAILANMRTAGMDREEYFRLLDEC